MMKVCKFGGSSMYDAYSIRLAKDIVTRDVDRRVVVVSAPGAGYGNDIKVTDLLYKCAKDKTYLDIVKVRFEKIVYDLGLDIDVSNLMSDIGTVFADVQDIQYLVSRGEYIMAKIFACFVGGVFVDASDLIVLDSAGHIDLDTTSANVKDKLMHDEVTYVVPGFYGSCENNIVLLSRGGSDVSGAILALTLNADLYENWTDVDGFFVCNPKICNNAPNLRMSYIQAVELANSGACVLHPDSSVLLSYKNIPIQIRNTFDSHKQGTIIDAFVRSSEQSRSETEESGSQANTAVEYDGHSQRVLPVESEGQANTAVEYDGYSQRVLPVESEGQANTAESSDRQVQHVPPVLDTLTESNKNSIVGIAGRTDLLGIIISKLTMSYDNSTTAHILMQLYDSNIFPTYSMVSKNKVWIALSRVTYASNRDVFFSIQRQLDVELQLQEIALINVQTDCNMIQPVNILHSNKIEVLYNSCVGGTNIIAIPEHKYLDATRLLCSSIIQ